MKLCPSSHIVRIECPSCLELAESRLLRVAGNAAIFSCGACEAEVSATVADAPVADAPEPSLTEVEINRAAKDACPKCQQHVPAETSHCPGCGLGRDKFASFDSGETPAAPELVSAWKRVESNWGANSAHEDFAAEVALAGNYRLGARFYRQASASVERAEKSRQMLDRMQSMATAALLSTKPKIVEEKQPYKNVVIVLMVMLMLAAGVGIILMSSKAGNPGAGPEQAQPRRKSWLSSIF